MVNNKLLQAMEMETEYRKYRLNWKAKTDFGYHNKLKSFGFADTIEYEKAKDEYYLRSSNIPVEYVDVKDLLTKRQSAIDECRNVLHIITSKETFIYAGNKADYNKSYCIENNLYTVVFPGKSVIVATEHDFAISLICKRHNIGNLLLEKLNQNICDSGINCLINGNDILVDGKKIVGSAFWRENCVSLYNYQVSFVIDKEKINTICKKEMLKEPIGISELSQIDRKSLIDKVVKWLQ